MVQRFQFCIRNLFSEFFDFQLGKLELLILLFEPYFQHFNFVVALSDVLGQLCHFMQVLVLGLLILVLEIFNLIVNTF